MPTEQSEAFEAHYITKAGKKPMPSCREELQKLQIVYVTVRMCTSRVTGDIARGKFLCMVPA